MNWLGFSSVAIGVAFFFLAQWSGRRPASPRIKRFSLGICLFLALPGVIYAIYYFRILGEPIWLYRLRAVPGTELLASLSGFFAGLIQVWVVPSLKLSRVGRRVLVPLVLVIVLALPYLKPILRPLKREALEDRWSEGVCMQSTFSTCGPASAATVLRELGARVSERELAIEAMTSDRGTENWYLARALRRRGFEVSFTLEGLSVKTPAVLGVRLHQYGSSGHFVALLGRNGDRFVIADPMEGKSTNTVAELEDKYELTGFAMLIERVE
ncbi:MAG TPA: cysteine peptidase family C39 domain-containing protein [Candidatus Paceibacterota bacterium]|nr:cysteine peptidase family C39 domain-containing protein [Candidatus Paceibacterota bacterium]